MTPPPIDKLFQAAEAHSRPVRLTLESDGFIFKDVTRFANPNGLNRVTFAFTHSTPGRHAKIMYFSYNAAPAQFRYRIEIQGTNNDD